MRRLAVALLVLSACGPDVSIMKQRVDRDSDGFEAEVDCDDSHASVNPDAPELCDGLDNDCDGVVDDDPTDGATFYADADGDGAGDPDAPTAACDAIDGLVADGDDCDDAEPRAFPGNAEVCDEIDNDCNGAVDDDATDAATFYADNDGDGYGDSALTVEGCTAEAGYVDDATDCADDDSAIHPGAAETDCRDPVDYNCDGSVGYDDADLDGTPACEDCDDSDGARAPTLPEVCDEADVDEDCDGAADDADDAPSDPSTWARDRDADGYGDSGSAVIVACEQPSGYVDDTTDCDDYDVATNPGATEVCDAFDLDEDCDGLADDDDTSVSAASWSTFYRDLDGDSYGDASRAVSQCEAPAAYVTDSADCDDADATRNPAATEVCDSVDNDCDSLVDDDDTSVTGGSDWYADADGDSYGAGAARAACAQPAGYVAAAGDCDDGDAASNPGEVEQCDAADTDEDCDGLVDDADTAPTGRTTWYGDSDADGYGLSTVTTSACDRPSGYAASAGDCDDASSAANPGETEVCDASNTDEDCDGLADDADVAATGFATWYRDLDGDTYGNASRSATACDQPSGYVASSTDCNDSASTISPAASEVCDGANTDEDCDGVADDSDASATGQSTFYRDQDTDTFGSATVTRGACDLPSGYVTNNTDCDDFDAATSAFTNWYADTDGDGYGNASAGLSACGQPAGYVANATDCDDTSASIRPGGTEVCDAANADEDCDGLADDADGAPGGRSTWYRDADGDTYGTSATTTSACDQPAGYVANASDCNDTTASVSPAGVEVCDAANTDEDCDGTADDSDASATGQSTFYRDQDTDTFGSATVTRSACDLPSGYVTNSTDCDDFDAATSVFETWYADLDGDGYGDPSDPVSACGLPLGYAANATDCDDGDAAISPAATEQCDAADTDEDCDGVSDDLDSAPTGRSTWYRDADSDAYGTSTVTTSACDVPAGYVATSTDCNDASAAISPGDPEICDASDTDEDCDGTSDDSDSSATGQGTWYRDADGDTYGTASTTLARCNQPSGYVTSSSDCNDGSTAISPAATEVCDAADTDEDCDGLADDADSSVTGKTTWYLDADGDAYGLATSTTSACNEPSGYTLTSTDCDDTDSAVSPAETEVCDNATDDDCDGVTDEYCGISGTLSADDADAKIYGDAASDQFGYSVGGGFDFNEDGVEDLVVGAPGDDEGGAAYGAVYVYTGDIPAGPEAASTSDYAKWYGTSTFNDVGETVFPLDDIDADGDDELMVGGVTDAYGNLVLGPQSLGARSSITTADYGTYNACSNVASAGNGGWLSAWWGYSTYTGQVQVYSGYSTVTATLYGESTRDYAGYDVSGGHDVDGDGYDDYLIGAYGDDDAGSEAGAAYVVYAPVSSTFSLSGADAKLKGSSASDYFGRNVNMPGDADLDGYADVIVSAWGRDTGGTDAGAVYLFNGPYASSTSASVADAVVYGAETNDHIGATGTAMSMGDSNGDGALDLLVSTYTSNAVANDSGQAWILYGPLSGSYDLTTDFDAAFQGSEANDWFGFSSTLTSDLDDDGLADIVIGAPVADERGYTDYGAVYVFYGR